MGVLAGDGIGPEVVHEALLVLECVSRRFDFDYELRHFPYGAEHYLATSEVLPDGACDALGDCHALYVGAVGDPRTPPGLLELGLLFRIIQEFELLLSIRPFRLMHESLCPLKGYGEGDIDLVIVREGYEGEVGLPSSTLSRATSWEVSSGQIVFTRRNVERTLRHGFELARGREGRLTLVDHANVADVYGIWRRALEDLRPEYPEIEAEAEVCDAFAMRMVKSPDEIDVVVSTLMLGGILADVAAGITGGLGVAASARLNPDTGFGLFEPVHGSAPKHAGRGVVSPLAAILSLALLLRHLGESEAATAIEAGVQLVVGADGFTVGTNSGLSTNEQTERILAKLDELA